MKHSKSKYRGYFNKYYKDMPFFEIITKDLNYIGLWIRNFLKNNFKSKTIFAHPHYPSRGSTIYKISKELGYNITNKQRSKPEFAIFWEYTTFRKEFRLLDEISKDKYVINLHSRDISKKYVDKIHQEVFGYSTMVDPLTYNGKIVKKSDINGTHNGEIVEGPVEFIEEDYIYQILIDNTIPGDSVMDIRVPFIGEALNFVYIKTRTISDRFKNPTGSKVEAISDHLSDNEIKQLNQYCKILKLDYGELDVLRDKKDGRIYVIDVNNTPQGPPSKTSKKDAIYAISEMTEAIRKLTSANKIHKKTDQ